MKKILTFLFITILASSSMLTNCCSSSSQDPEEDMSKNIGKTVTIDNETFTIINHDNLYEEYTLSNGTTISDKYPISY